MRFKMLNGKWKMKNMHVKCKMFKVLAMSIGLLVILAACGKVEKNRPANETPAPFSRGPNGLPKISAPTYPPPGS